MDTLNNLNLEERHYAFSGISTQVLSIKKVSVPVCESAENAIGTFLC